MIDEFQGQWQLANEAEAINSNKEETVSRKLKHRHLFHVVCIWCGVKIRDDKEHNTTGVCLKCFYRILSNHLQSQKKVAYGEFVSDR